MCVLQMQESLTCQRKNAMIHLSGCGIQLVSKKGCLSRAPALHLLSTHVDLFAWRSSLPPPYRIRVDLLFRPCPKWNTSCALAILRTYNGRRVRLSVKSVGCPIPHFSVYKDARERPLLRPLCALDTHRGKRKVIQPSAQHVLPRKSANQRMTTAN